MKAAIYLRQSSDPTGAQLGVSRQREDCTKLCEAKGWAWAEYVDNDTSATKRKPRPAYQEMLTDIRNGAIGAVVVWHMDRLHRQPMELEEFINLADAKGVALATVTGDVDLSTDTGRLVARITGAVARAETERKVARMTRRYRQDAEAGKPHPTRTAFGYTRQQQLDERESAAVRKAYADVLAGASLGGIATAWNAQGFTSGRGKQWDATGVRVVLLNARNAGLRSHHGEIVAQGTWPAIVDRDTFDTVTALLRNPGRRIGATRGRKYLLSGLALCGKCGKTVGSRMPPKRGQQPRYHCKHCNGVARKVDWVDDWVMRVVADRLSRPDAADLFAKRNRPDLAKLRATAGQLREDQDKMAVAHAQHKVTLSQLIAYNETVARQLADIEAQTADTATVRVLAGVIKPGEKVTAAQVRERIESLDLDRKRAIIDVLLTLTILPGQARGALRTDLLPITWKD
jgi:DNA invertase Pin-like site-specific DNA recombinase/cytochrome c553